MTRSAALFLLLGSGLAAACDSASVYEQCAQESEVGSGHERCFPSTFAKEDPRARESAGFVLVGSERVPNAPVSVNGTPTLTDSAGIYRFPGATFRYDVAARIDNEVIAFTHVARRFIELAVERDGPVKGFSATVQVFVKDAPHAGNRLAFFVSGENVVGLSGDLGGGFVVSSRTYENDKAKLHVVEYPENGDLGQAVAKGSVELRLRANTSTNAEVSLDPVEERKSVTFAAVSDVPDGFTFEDIEISLDMGLPVSRVPVRKVRLGEKLELPVMGDEAGWLARTTATRADGSLASIGLRPFRPGDDVTLAFYAPPSAERNEGATLFAKSAQGIGVFEHVLVPTSGAGATIHVFSARAEANVPDLAPLGLPPARGEYRWTVRVFPDFDFVESMSGVGNRLYRSSSTSAPRTVVLP